MFGVSGLKAEKLSQSGASPMRQRLLYGVWGLVWIFSHVAGGFAVGDIVKEGQTVQFQLRDAAAASEDFHALLTGERAAQGGLPPAGALIFSCNGRGQRFFRASHHDAGAIRDEMGSLPVAGFFAMGEIGPVGGNNFLHSYTASVALFVPADSSST